MYPTTTLTADTFTLLLPLAPSLLPVIGLPVRPLRLPSRLAWPPTVVGCMPLRGCCLVSWFVSLCLDLSWCVLVLGVIIQAERREAMQV
jgi:hypothetical protein